MVIGIEVEEKLFEFSSFTKWVNKASSWFDGIDLNKIICVDTKGRICVKGVEFMRARDEEAFPVSVYRIC